MCGHVRRWRERATCPDDGRERSLLGSRLAGRLDRVRRVRRVRQGGCMHTKIGTAIGSGSAESAVASVTRDLQRQLGGAPPALVMAFSSTAQPLEDVVGRLVRTFPSAVILGSSTAGEFI